jgi:hypothetical protein
MQDLLKLWLWIPAGAGMTKTVRIYLLKLRETTARGSHRRMMNDAGDRRRSHPARSNSGM